MASVNYEKYERLLEKKGVKTAEVCRNTGIDTATISNWKLGNYTPKIDKIQRIADYFGVSVTYFLES